MMKKLIVSALVLGAMLVGCAPTDAELTEQGWVKDPAENGWVENPATNGWVKDPATNGWVKDPATNGWVKDPAENGWVKDPAENGWVENPAENGWVKDPATNGWVENPAENGWVSEDQLTPSPVVLDKIVHWVPGAEDANVSWEVDLKGATTLNVVLAGKLLQEYVDYNYDTESSLLEVYGVFLTDAGLDLGKHDGLVFTEYGSTPISFTIIETAVEEGTTIPLTEKLDVDLSGFGAHTITEPLADAGSLLITEIGVDMGLYCYIEVFNNTTSEYNLKDHRVVFADPSKQKKNYANGLIDLPLGSAGVTYIYQDYKIPALSSALIWIVNSSPWEVASNKLSEAAGAQSLILGDKPENLGVDDFRRVYGLDEETLVFPARTSYMLGRSDAWAQPSEANGFWGTALAKSASNRWTDINSKVDNRLIQIQKVDETTVFEEEGKFYVWEMDVLHKEEEIYADGILDANDVLTNSSGAIATTNRQFIHGLFARKTYVTSATDKTPTGEYVGMDLYNCNEAGYYAMLETAVSPLATAMIYPHLTDIVTENEDGTTSTSRGAAKWGNTYSQFALQYAVPAAGSHMARFIPLEGTAEEYKAHYASHTYKDLYLAGIGAEITGYGANSTVYVPVDPAYPVDYLNRNHNTAGRVTVLMVPPVTE